VLSESENLSILSFEFFNWRLFDHLPEWWPALA
jgi:hypothetical protein